MKVEVQLVNTKGVPIPAKERASMPKYRGVLHVREARVQSLGRIVATAELSSCADKSGQTLVPPLLDADVLFLLNTQMRIRGFEMVNGAQYGQTWDVRVLPC
jgi:hypothetical protein